MEFGDKKSTDYIAPVNFFKNQEIPLHSRERVNTQTERLKVPGGWVYITIAKEGVAQTFVAE